MNSVGPEILVIIGNDAVGRKAFDHLERAPFDGLVAWDKSRSKQSIYRLIKKGRIPLAAFVRMAMAEAIRRLRGFRLRRRRRDAVSITSNDDVISIVRRHPFDAILCFRAGLIINSDVLSLGVPVLNIHAARIPEFGGLASIYRALQAGSLDQVATLHRITERIDDGEVLATQAYLLSRSVSYRRNEDVAYDAALDLLDELVREPRKYLDQL
jgi:methionyl-tRNA formyltransferase